MSMAIQVPKFGFQEYVPDKKDLCSLCGSNVGEHLLVQCKDDILICPDCIDLLAFLRRQKQAERDENTIQAMLVIESSMPDAYQPRELFEALIKAVRDNKIPRIHVDF
ncbi:hypothetical protein HA41_00415 [Pantoea conspicua]|uniref:ClpX-type ZB domain-containing protein n=3 Tax=Pantoea TaxID=53335 RepID=A0A1X1C2Q5_9GAMM|nr:hypothetical protein HA41_00415 [Pantoea conspicua]